MGECDKIFKFQGEEWQYKIMELNVSQNFHFFSLSQLVVEVCMISTSANRHAGTVKKLIRVSIVTRIEQ